MSKDIHQNSTLSLQEQIDKGLTKKFRRAIFDLIKASAVPLTDRQLMQLLHETDVNNVRPEVTRLKQDGLLIETNKVTCQWTGKRVRQTTWTGKPYFDRGQPQPAAFSTDHNGQMSFT